MAGKRVKKNLKKKTMRKFVCDVCPAAFVRKAHLEQHRGTATCLRGSLRLKKNPQKGNAGGKHMARKMERRCGSFVAMLKKNVRACLQSSAKSVGFVPYAAGYEAADMQALGSAARRQARLEGLDPSSKAAAPRMWAMCKALAFFMTTDAVEVLQVPPIPWVDSYSAGLSRRLWALREAKVQVMNVGFQHCSRRSFVGTGMSATAARSTIANLVAIVKESVTSVEKISGQTQLHRDEYYQLLASHGQPAMGYVQKLAVALAESARVQDLCPLTHGGLLELLGCDSGCAAGMRQITDDTLKQLANKAFLCLRLKMLCKVVRQVWQNTAPRVAWSQGKRTEAQKAEALAVQLCQWTKGNFGEEVIRPRSFGALELATDASSP